jgi:GT2 family glycosyltransferase
VGVVIVNYHAYDEVEACLTSLKGQSLANLEVIVVDHDSETSRCERLRRRFPSAQIIASADNPGFAAGVNRGAARSRARYLYLLNPDAVAERRVCETLAQWLDDHADIGVVGSMVHDPDGAIQASARRFPDLSTGLGGRTSWLTRVLPGNPLTRRNLLTGPQVRQPIIVDWVSGASMMIRRSAFDAVGGMDEGFFLYWEDADFCVRLRRAGWLTAYHPGAAVTHIGGRSSRASSASVVAFHRSAYRYIRKHGGRPRLVLTPIAFVLLYTRMAAKLVKNFFSISGRRPATGRESRTG